MDTNPDLASGIYQKACDYLSRRDHSVLELYNKLTKFFLQRKDHYEFTDEQELSAAIAQTMDKLKKLNFVSNERFTEKFIEHKLNRYQGPLLIQQHLRTKGITNELWLEKWSQFEDQSADICKLALAKWLRRHQREKITNLQEKAKATRYLSSQGFYQHTIYDTLASFEE